MGESQIKFRFLSQEDLVEAGAFDIPMAIGALKEGLLKFGTAGSCFPIRSSVTIGRRSSTAPRRSAAAIKRV